MKRRRLFLLSLLLIAVAAFLGRDLFQEYVAPELLYTAWRVYILVDTIPQIILWGILVALLIVMAARSMNPRRAPGSPEVPPGAYRPGRIGDLARSLRFMESSRYVRQETLRALDRLVVETLSQSSRRERPEIERAWAGGEVPVDEAVREFLAPVRRRDPLPDPSPAPVTGRFPWLVRRRRDLASWLRTWRPGSPAKALDPRLEQTVRFLERAVDE